MLDFRVCFGRDGEMYRLLRSTSAFLQTKLEYRRPTPLILVMAYMTFSLPSTCMRSPLVFIRILPHISNLPSSRDQDFVVACFRGDGGDIGVVRTLVLRRRRMNWKFDFSPVTRDMLGGWRWGVDCLRSEVQR